jgi:hypothetical protein
MSREENITCLLQRHVYIGDCKAMSMPKQLSEPTEAFSEANWDIVSIHLQSASKNLSTFASRLKWIIGTCCCAAY